MYQCLKQSCRVNFEDRFGTALQYCKFFGFLFLIGRVHAFVITK